MAENRHSPKPRLALERAARQNDTVRLEALEFSRDDVTDSVNVTVAPVVERNSGPRLFAVIFEDAGAPTKAAPPGAPETETEKDILVGRLEAENNALKEELQTASDGFQTMHEELTAANEEILAINEELQSTNEELVTSKEELQSVNEELITTNNQLNDKVEELGETNDDLANFLNSAEVGTIFLDRKFCIRRFTPSATELMNLLPLDMGRPVSHISSKFIDTDLVAIADGVLKTLIPVEKEVLTSDGLWHMLRCLPYRTSNDLIDGVVFTFTDITRLKHSEQAMIEARDYAENILHTTREALLVLDPELKIVSANLAFYETFQVSPEETEGRLIYELGNRQWDIPALRELLEEILPTNSVIHDFEVKYDFPTIGPKIMSLNARSIYNRMRKQVRLILLAITDITERSRIEHQRHELSRELEKKVSELEQANRALLQDMEERKRLEDQLRQAQKMESMGTLAAGIAHDLNNILNIIQGYTFVLGRGAESDEIGESVEVITETTKRGAALVQQLLTLARKTETKLESINANTVIQELSNLLKETFPKSIELTLDLARRLPAIMADPNQITQVLLNLCVNARDAMPDGGRLALKTDVIDGKELEEYGDLKAAEYVSIEVTDTGTGMDENVQSRIFEPFFTTKETGQGTGLGLAVVYGIVKSHNGFVQVKSKPMRGTTFRLYFPVVSSGG
jgi:two-component system, chemotaxis family, CheB/CheR fusion protein